MSGQAPVDCEDVLRHLFEWLDGELDEERHESVSAHLALCRSCFSRAEFEKRLKAHLRDVGRATVPPDLERRIRTVVDGLRH